MAFYLSGLYLLSTCYLPIIAITPSFQPDMMRSHTIVRRPPASKPPRPASSYSPAPVRAHTLPLIGSAPPPPARQAATAPPPPSRPQAGSAPPPPSRTGPAVGQLISLEEQKRTVIRYISAQLVFRLKVHYSTLKVHLYLELFTRLCGIQPGAVRPCYFCFFVLYTDGVTVCGTVSFKQKHCSYYS